MIMTGTTGDAKFGKYEGLLLFALCMTGFTSALIASLQAPFFPAEAEKKGLSASEYGVTFGMYGLAVFFVSPILGSLLQEVGGRCMLYVGTIIASSSTILFGLLTYIYSHIGFLLVSYALRIIEAIGVSATLVALFSFAGSCFPRHVGQCFGIVQAMYGTGLSVGPLIGAIFYNIGGFTLPFVAVGVMNFVTGGFSFAILPSSTKQKKVSADEGKNWDLFRSLRLLKISSIRLYAACITISVLTSNFINAILEPNLRQFELTVLQVSLVFLMQPAMQCILSAVWGSICDKVSNPEIIPIVGAILFLTGTLLVGPSSFLPFKPSLTLTVISLGLLGVGQSAITVSSLFLSLREAKNNGYADDESTSSLISGLVISALASGLCLGPFIAGILFDQFGFRQSTIFIAFLNFSMLVALGFSTRTGLIESRAKADNEARIRSTQAGSEIDPLLPDK